MDDKLRARLDFIASTFLGPASVQRTEPEGVLDVEALREGYGYHSREWCLGYRQCAVDLLAGEDPWVGVARG